MELFKKMEPYHSPLWSIEILLFLLVCTTWFIGCVTEIAILSILAFGFTQILGGWIGHSAAHSRDKKLNIFGRL
jgi:hypothetical protein